MNALIEELVQLMRPSRLDMIAKAKVLGRISIEDLHFPKRPPHCHPSGACNAFRECRRRAPRSCREGARCGNACCPGSRRS